MSKYRAYVYAKGPLKGIREKSIYEDASENKYLRIVTGKRDSFKPLGTKKIGEAIKTRDARVKAEVAADLGLAANPAAAAAAAKVTVAVVINRYSSDGYPGKRGTRRKAGSTLDGEITRCKILLEYFNGTAPAADLDQDDLDNYHTWRVKKVEQGPLLKSGKRGKVRGEGDRITDMELNTLNSAYRWGKRKRLLKTNQVSERVRYRSQSDVQHCRDFSFESPEELHEAAGRLMSSRRSEVLGWQLLIEGTSGLRTEEAVLLKMQAGVTEPGGLTPGGKNLCVRRAKKSKRHNPYVRVNDGLGQILSAASKSMIGPSLSVVHTVPSNRRKLAPALSSTPAASTIS